MYLVRFDENSNTLIIRPIKLFLIFNFAEAAGSFNKDGRLIKLKKDFA